MHSHTPPVWIILSPPEGVRIVQTHYKYTTHEHFISPFSLPNCKYLQAEVCLPIGNTCHTKVQYLGILFVCVLAKVIMLKNYGKDYSAQKFGKDRQCTNGA